MLDEKDLQAIAQMLSPISERLGKLEQQQAEIATETKQAIGEAEKRIATETKQAIGEAEQRIATETKQAIGEAEQRIAKNTVVLIDAEFRPQFKLLSEELDIIKDKLPNLDEMEIMQSEIDNHHTMIKLHTNAIQEIRRKLRRAE